MCVCVADPSLRYSQELAHQSFVIFPAPTFHLLHRALPWRTHRFRFDCRYCFISFLRFASLHD